MKENEELKHYGVPGMKWGNRKSIRLQSGQSKTSRKQIRQNQIKSNVKKYSKAFDKNMSEYDRADENNAKVKELYKKTGKNAVSRIINNIKGTSKEVKAYSKAYDKNMAEYDRADRNFEKVKKLRKDIGRNAVSRVINAIKYS